MNILFFTQLFYPNIFGGGEYIFYLLAKELVKRGHGVQVITQRLHDSSKFEIVDGIKVHRVGSELVYSGTLPPTIRHNLEYLVQSTAKGLNVLRDDTDRTDIIHSNTYVPALSGQLCSKLYHVPHVVTFHDVYQASDDRFWNLWQSHQNMNNIPFYASRLSKIVEKLVMKLDVSAFHTVSEASMDDLRRFGVRKNIFVIPNGLDPSMYQVHLSASESHTENPTAVFVGRLVFYKNVEIVIRAFRKVIERFPLAQLIIIGDGPHRDILVKEAKQLQDNVVFTGRVTHQKKIECISKASFIVFPSLIEGFGIAIIEGFACHKPVLVSDVRPLSDIVKDNQTGYVISHSDVDSWANRMIDLFENEEKRKILSENAFAEFISKYNIENVAKQVESLYHNLLEKGN